MKTVSRVLLYRLSGRRQASIQDVSHVVLAVPIERQLVREHVVYPGQDDVVSEAVAKGPLALPQTVEVRYHVQLYPSLGYTPKPNFRGGSVEKNRLSLEARVVSHESVLEDSAGRCVGALLVAYHTLRFQDGFAALEARDQVLLGSLLCRSQDDAPEVHEAFGGSLLLVGFPQQGHGMLVHALVRPHHLGQRREVEEGLDVEVAVYVVHEHLHIKFKYFSLLSLLIRLEEFFGGFFGFVIRWGWGSTSMYKNAK